jgi:hypothetical protein
VTLRPALRFIIAIPTVAVFVMPAIVVPSVLAPTFFPAAIIIVAAFAALTRPAGAQLTHFLAGLFPLVFIQLAVAVFVELFDDFLAHR